MVEGMPFLQAAKELGRRYDGLPRSREVEAVVCIDTVDQLSRHGVEAVLHRVQKRRDKVGRISDGGSKAHKG
jgi:hypothetical protein